MEYRKARGHATNDVINKMMPPNSLDAHIFHDALDILIHNVPLLVQWNNDCTRVKLQF